MTTKINADNPVEATQARNNSLAGKAGPRKVDISAGGSVRSDAEERLKAIMDGLAETVLTMSDAEILDEVRMQGRDPVREAEETRKVLTDALKVVARKVDRPHQPS
jgi:hypothetical protein